MDWWLKALLTAGTVALVMGVARHAGPRCAGLVAALPTVTAPTLVWLVHERGLAFALNAAIGSVSACAMLAAFAAVYAALARRGGVAVALGGGLLAAAALAWPALLASDNLAAAALLALAACGLALAAMPTARAGTAHRGEGRSGNGPRLVCTALAAAGLSVLAATAGPALGTFATGLLSSLPVTSGIVAVMEHGAGGHRAASRFLRGYVAGLLGKLAFGAVFVVLAWPLGVAWALSFACACACGAAALAARALHLAGPRPWAGRLARE